MAYTPHQKKMIALALKLSASDPPKVRRALLEAMAVESNFRNLNYGDRDSQGVLQQRPSTGWGAPGNATQDINQFLERARRTGRGFRGSAGSLAQAVQRSAFPERYDKRLKQANELLGQARPLPPPPKIGGFGSPPPGLPDLTSTILSNLGGIASGDWDPVEQMGLLASAASVPRAKPGPASGADPVDPRGHKVQNAVKALDPGGGWGGAYAPATSLANLGRQYGLTSTSEKRDRKTTKSGGTSDHWAGNKNAYAYDLGGSVKDMDAAAVAIAKQLGIPYKKGQPLVATVNRNGLRYQILYRTQVGGDHFTHIHAGVRRT